MKDPQIVDEAFSQIESLVEQGKIEKAQTKLKDTFKIPKKIIETAPLRERMATLKLKMGIHYTERGKIRIALRLFLSALKFFKEIKSVQGEIRVYNELAGIEFNKAKYNSAIKYIEVCISLSRKIGDKFKEAIYIVNRGRIYMLQGKLQLAEEDFLFGLKTLKALKEVATKEKDQKKLNLIEVNISKTLRSLGYVQYLRRRFREAKELIEEAYQITERKGSVRDVAVHHEYRGAVDAAQGDFASAREHYNKVIEIMEPIGPESDMMSQTYRLFAELEIAERKYDQALSSCRKGLKIAEKIEDWIEVGAIQRALGQIYTAQKDHQRAKEHFKKSMSILKARGANYELGLTYIEVGHSDVFSHRDRRTYLGNAKKIFKGINVPYYVGETVRLEREVTAEPRMIKREELEGYVKKIIDDKAYIIFETPKGPLERAVKLSRLEDINADRQGAMVNFVVEGKGASRKVKFENLEQKGTPTWRDKIKDEELKKFAFPRKNF